MARQGARSASFRTKKAASTSLQAIFKTPLCVVRSDARFSWIGAQAIVELDIADPLAVVALVSERIARPLADSLPLPLRNRRHDVQHKPSSWACTEAWCARRSVALAPPSSATHFPTKLRDDPLPPKIARPRTATTVRAPICPRILPVPCCAPDSPTGSLLESR